ncbi:MAG: chorismate-binding protein, partial [Leifsonia sp.]
MPAASPLVSELVDELRRLAVAPVRSETLDLWVEPELVFGRLLGREPYAYWLDAGPDARSGWTFMGDAGGPLGYVLSADPDRGVTRVLHPATCREAEAPTSVLDVVTATLEGPARDVEGCALGWVGWWGYETGARELGVRRAPVGAPDTVLLFGRRQLAFDHRRRQVRLVSLDVGDDAGDRAWRRRCAAALAELVGRAPETPAPAADAPAVRARHSPDAYRGLVRACQDHIRDGDAYQLCLTNRFETETTDDPFLVYRRMRRANPTHLGALVVAADTALLSTSPEVFLDLRADGT